MNMMQKATDKMKAMPMNSAKDTMSKDKPMMDDDM